MFPHHLLVTGKCVTSRHKHYSHYTYIHGGLQSSWRTRHWCSYIGSATCRGWDRGVEGMRVGDKRRLTIPPQMVRCLQCAGWSGLCSTCHFAGLPDNPASLLQQTVSLCEHTCEEPSVSEAGVGKRQAVAPALLMRLDDTAQQHSADYALWMPRYAMCDVTCRRTGQQAPSPPSPRTPPCPLSWSWWMSSS